MLKVLEFVFQDFWHFVGTCILLCIIISPIANFRLINFTRTDTTDDSKSAQDKQN